MKKMSTKKIKMKIVKASLLTFVFLFMGLLGANAQTASQLGNEKALEVMNSLFAEHLSHKAQLQSTSGQAATDLKQVASYYRNVAKSFKRGADLGDVMLSTMESSTNSLSYLSQEEMDALHTQVDKIKSSNADSAELELFYTLLENSKN